MDLGNLCFGSTKKDFYLQSKNSPFSARGRVEDYVYTLKEGGYSFSITQAKPDFIKSWKKAGTEGEKRCLLRRARTILKRKENGTHEKVSGSSCKKTV